MADKDNVPKPWIDVCGRKVSETLGVFQSVSDQLVTGGQHLVHPQIVAAVHPQQQLQLIEGNVAVEQKIVDAAGQEQPIGQSEQIVDAMCQEPIDGQIELEEYFDTEEEDTWSQHSDMTHVSDMSRVSNITHVSGVSDMTHVSELTQLSDRTYSYRVRFMGSGEIGGVPLNGVWVVNVPVIGDRSIDVLLSPSYVNGVWGLSIVNGAGGHAGGIGGIGQSENNSGGGSMGNNNGDGGPVGWVAVFQNKYFMVSLKLFKEFAIHFVNSILVDIIRGR